MPPHNDAPSPVGSYTPQPTTTSTPNLSSSLLRSPLYPQPHHTSSFETASISSSDGAMTDRPDRPLKEGGVYVPIACLFNPVTEDVDYPAVTHHVVRLAESGVAGIATQGSNGEAVHLTQDERGKVTRIARKALDDAGFTSLPIIVGCGAQSTRETVSLCRQAYEAGGDYALILPPSYYSGLFLPSSATVIDYFTKVAKDSPIPIIIYNYPGAVSGLDLNSDVIIQLSQIENIAGVKLTCGNTGKLKRVAKGTKSTPKSLAASSSRQQFFVLGGSADFTLPTLINGGHGILAGLANIAPKACVEMIKLYRQGKVEEARAIQDVIADGDWVVIQSGVVGTKSLLETYFGYGGFARAPLPRPTKEQSLEWKNKAAEMMELESRLE